MVDENGITVVGYESPRELVGIVKVEPKEKGRGKKRGATAGAGGPGPPAVKRANKVVGDSITVVGFESPKELVGVVKVEGRAAKEKGRGKRNPAKCVHNKRKSQCKECGGSGLCPHGRQKRKCKECRGSGLCPHGRQKRQCKECGGSGLSVPTREAAEDRV
jgi:hypothetical protein